MTFYHLWKSKTMFYKHAVQIQAQSKARIYEEPFFKPFLDSQIQGKLNFPSRETSSLHVFDFNTYVCTGVLGCVLILLAQVVGTT